MWQSGGGGTRGTEEREEREEREGREGHVVSRLSTLCRRDFCALYGEIVCPLRLQRRGKAESESEKGVAAQVVIRRAP